MSTFILSFYWKGRYPVVYSAQHLSSCSQIITFQFALWNYVLQVPCVWAKLPTACQSKWTRLLCTYLSLHADIYKKVSTFIYIYVKMCIFRAMSTGLKMQYPEAITENGKKKKKKPKIDHLFLINFIFLYSKTCVAQTDTCGWNKAELLFLCSTLTCTSSLYVALVYRRCRPCCPCVL